MASKSVILKIIPIWEADMQFQARNNAIRTLIRSQVICPDVSGTLLKGTCTQETRGSRLHDSVFYYYFRNEGKSRKFRRSGGYM